MKTILRSHPRSNRLWRPILFTPPLLLAACASHQPEIRRAIPVPVTTITREDLPAVRSPEVLKAYPVGRYEDPAHPEVLHEAHTVYRAETPSRWNLNLNNPPDGLMGPSVRPAPAVRTMLTAELEQQIQQQNGMLAAAGEQNRRLAGDIARMQEAMSKLRATPASTAPEKVEPKEPEVQLRPAEPDWPAESTMTLTPAGPLLIPAPPDTAAKPPTAPWWRLWR